MTEGCHAPQMNVPHEVRVRVVRVFTRDGSGGNHLAIHDGSLPDDVMESVATSLGYSETIFVNEPDDDEVFGVRIFTPADELPFAGHPLVGATWHLATPGAAVALRCAIGVVAGHRGDGDTASIEVTYLPAVERTTTPGVIASWTALMPLPYEVHLLESPDAVAAYELVDRPDHRLVWARAGRGDGIVRARFFAPGMGVVEDPATGSAAVALAAVLRHEGEKSGSVMIHQGAEVGSRSSIDLSWTVRDTVIGGAVCDDGSRTVSVPLGL
jgi:trans-2,3-dihydro-3-hydroxyanthranilate isomerase